MDKHQLIETAKQLQQVSNEAYAEYIHNSDLLIGKITNLMQERLDLEALIGINNSDMLKDNHANHVRFMSSIFKNYNAEVFLDTILWVFRAYRSHGFKTNFWAAYLNNWIVVLKQILSHDSNKQIIKYYEWMQINIPIFVKLTDKDFDASKLK